jgi:hypothetical protein
MSNGDFIERTAPELIKLHPQLGCWSACDWEHGAAGGMTMGPETNGTVTRSCSAPQFMCGYPSRSHASCALSSGLENRQAQDLVVEALEKMLDAQSDN